MAQRIESVPRMNRQKPAQMYTCMRCWTRTFGEKERDDHRASHDLIVLTDNQVSWLTAAGYFVLGVVTGIVLFLLIVRGVL